MIVHKSQSTPARYSSISSLAKNIFCINRNPYSFSIRVLGRRVFFYRHQIVMSFDTGHNKDIIPSIPVSLDKITEDNIDQFSAIAPGISSKKPFLAQEHGKCEGFGLWTDDGRPAGYVWVLYRGGEIGNFRLQNIDAWIFAVLVGKEYRRNGCCEYMLHSVLNYLKCEKKIDEAYLNVSIRNYPAKNAYKKAGGTEITHIKSLRIFRIRIPFHDYAL